MRHLHDRRMDGTYLVFQSLCSSRSTGGINCQALPHKISSGIADVRPILLGLKLVVSSDNGFHLLLLRVAIKRRITSKQEVSDNTHCPNINRLSVSSWEDQL